MSKSVKIRDLRIKEKFQIDDEYLNGYARLCGWKATLVYSSLCRHSDKDQYSFPSVELMAQQHNVNRKTIIAGIKALQEWNIIEVIKERTKDGTWRNNGYTLLDKSEWIAKPVEEDSRSKNSQPRPPQGHGKPRPSQGLDQVPHKDIKDTHKKEPHNNENDNGTFKESSLRADLNIEQGNKKYINDIIEYYKGLYKEVLGRDHPNLKSEQLQKVKDAIRAFDEKWNMNGEQWRVLITQWFTIEIETDYNLNHFISDEILNKRYLEVLY